MEEKDERFNHPIEFVKQHVLGCFEASKACCILPGKPHLYHVEFLKRDGNVDVNLPLDFHLQAHFSPCEEVSWYLHTRKDFPVYEGSVTADDKYVEEHQEGVIEPGAKYLAEVAAVHLERSIAMLTQPLVSNTPEKLQESVIDTEDVHGRGKKAKSRFERIGAELRALREKK